MEVLADSWYIIRMLYRVWHHSERRRQQQTKFVKLLPEILQSEFCIMDWMTLMLYQLQMSSMIYSWFSGSCHIKGPQFFQNIRNNYHHHKASHPRKPHSSDTPPCEPQIPQIFSSLFIRHNQPQDCGVDTPHLRWDYCHMPCNDNSNSPLSFFPKHYPQNAHINPQDTPLSVNH